MRAALIAGLGCALAAAGCGTSDDRREARLVAAQLHAGVAAGDGEAACVRLSPPAAAALEREEKRPCATAVVDLELGSSEVAEVEVWETEAVVIFADGGRTFLGRRPGGWKVSAAGCRPQPGGPAECEVES